MTTDLTEDPVSLRRELAGDLHRPQYHYLPPNNWMNDPNGVCYFDGRYHLFYQKNPFGPLWGFMHWGHASSPDLIHWTDHPIALAPEEGAGDDLGVFSGCIVEDDGVPTAIYTGVKSFVDTPVLLAQAKDANLNTWEKYAKNPIIPEKPEGVNSTDYRDPYVWRQGNRWQMVVGAGMADGDGAILLYESEDLLEWRYLGAAFKHRTLDSVTMWECPNFFPLDGKFVLLVSLYPDIQGVYYYVGEYDGRTFTPEHEGFLEQDGILYAPQVRRFPDGRTLLFGWLREQRSDEAIEAAGWAGVLSLPRELKLDRRGQLNSRPVREVECLRRNESTSNHLELRPRQSLTLPISGKQIEILVSSRCEGKRFELGVAASPDAAEFTLIDCDPVEGKIRLDTTHSSLSNDVITGVQELAFTNEDKRDIQLRVLLDGSVIEIWVNEAFSLSGRIYPTRTEAQTIFVRSGSNGVQDLNLTVWEFGCIWEK